MLTKLFVNYLIISVSISLVIIVLMISSPLLRKRYAAKWRSWIWMVLAICLLLPFNFSFEKSLISIQLPSGLEAFKKDSVLPNASPSEQTTIPASQSTTIATTQPMTERLNEQMNQSMTTPEAKQETETVSQTFSLIKLISFAWCVGAIVFWLYHFIGYYLFKRQALRWSSPIVNKHMEEIVIQLVEEMKVKASSISVLTSAKVPNPMLIGFNKPYIFLPHENYNDEQLEFILRHELIHHKRHDIIYKLLLIIVNGIHWFNPFVWFMVREANHEIEICCDDMVVQKQSLIYRKEYCRAILSAMQNGNVPNTALSTNFSGRKYEMKQRFMNVLSVKKKRNGIVPFCTVLLLIGAITILSACTNIVNGQSNNATSKPGNISSQSSNREENASKGNEDDIPGLLTKETAKLKDQNLLTNTTQQ
ncbi:hypothetical protein J22TS3_48590 [Paenibacillus sp. J22TS3]|nr:hypothetical protein J22TS3_48590 [Paenibacillus sp. J22TS3]